MASQKENEPLKAVVFADSCNNNRSISLIDGKSLANVSVLTWQLASLARFGVKQAIVLSSTEISEAYSDPLGRMQITYLSSPAWSAEGDALRDLESRDGLCPVDDFILVRAGAISNINVSALVAAHKKRRQADRNWLITSVFRRTTGSSPTNLTLAVDACSGTLIKYVDSMPETGLSIDVTSEHAGLRIGGRLNIYTDVLDTGLDVCAPEFLVEFRENFYYSHVRAYIQEKLDGGEAEIFGNRMYAHFTDSRRGEYAARITSLTTLAQTTSDVLNGWMAPIAPYNRIGNQVPKLVSASNQRNFVTDRVILGDSVSIGVGSTLAESVIGNDVTIGSDVTISHCIIADGCVIGDRSDLIHSIIEQDCRVQDDCSIPRNCFLDESVCLGREHRPLRAHSLITLKDPSILNIDYEEEKDISTNAETDERRLVRVDDGEEAVMVNKSEEGGSMNISYANGISRPEDEEDVDLQAMDVGKLEIGNASTGTIGSEDGEGDTEDVDEIEGMVDLDFEARGIVIPSPHVVQLDHFFREREIAVVEYVSDVDDDLEVEDLDEINGDIAEDDSRKVEIGEDEIQMTQFSQEVMETIERAFAENVDVGNTTTEVKSLKVAYDRSFSETVSQVVGSLARHVEALETPSCLYAAVVTALRQYSGLISNFNDSNDLKHHKDIAYGLAEMLRDKGTLLMYVFKGMHEEKMLDEDGILMWSQSERERVESGDNDSELLTTLQPLLDWLEDTEDEEDEDDEESEENE